MHQRLVLKLKRDIRKVESELAHPEGGLFKEDPTGESDDLLHNRPGFLFERARLFLPEDDMALRCARLERLLTSRTSTLTLACKRHASSSATLAHPAPTDAEQRNVDAAFSDPSAHPPRRPKVEEYLQYVAQNSTATLQDLESFWPKSHASVGSAKYEAQYQALLEKLDRSFTVNQLRQFLHLYGLPASSKMRKHTAATTIIEKQWGWPSLAKSQKLARSKKERSSRGRPTSFSRGLFV